MPLTFLQCIRMVLNKNGITGGWNKESMPMARLMSEAVMMPYVFFSLGSAMYRSVPSKFVTIYRDGKLLIVNGAGTGVAGYGNVANQVGQSNADHPILQPLLYDPAAAAGSRFLTTLPQSTVPRMYHSTATLLPDGRVMLTGSNPNADVSKIKYQTEYRIEYISRALPPCFIWRVIGVS